MSLGLIQRSRERRSLEGRLAGDLQLRGTLVKRDVYPAETCALATREVDLLFAKKMNPGAFAECAIRRSDWAIRKKLEQRAFPASCGCERRDLPLLVQFRQKLSRTIILVQREELTIDAQEGRPSPTCVNWEGLLCRRDIRQAPGTRISDVPFE